MNAPTGSTILSADPRAPPGHYHVQQPRRGPGLIGLRRGYVDDDSTDGRLDRYRARRALADARRATRDVCGADAAPRIERFARRDGIQMTVGLFAHTLHRRFESRTVD